MLVGLAMLVSATYAHATLSPLFITQSIAAGICLVVMLLIARMPYHAWRKYAFLVYIAGIISLATVSWIGPVIRGTTSRLSILGFQIQPSELMKVAIVISVAWLLSRYQIIRLKQVVITLGFITIPVILVLAEPDIGMAFLIICTIIGMLIFLGMQWRIVGVLALLGSIIMVGAWHWTLLDYQKNRILTFLDPTADPLSAGYNVTQSMIAFGSGQLLGRGLGHGPQSQLKFLPERHTDFILASLGEELGFIGILLVITLYAIMLWRILAIARTTNDPFGQLISVGVFFTMLISFTVSVGMNMGILPVTGIPLPLVSYGGSNLVTTFFLIGLVESVKAHNRFVQAPPKEISHFG